jgi:hypothetical protein
MVKPKAALKAPTKAAHLAECWGGSTVDLKADLSADRSGDLRAVPKVAKMAALKAATRAA